MEVPRVGGRVVPRLEYTEYEEEEGEYWEVYFVE